MLRPDFYTQLLRSWMRPLGKLRNRHFLLIDVFWLCLLPAVALYMRVETPAAMKPYIPALVEYTIFALAVRLLIFYLFGIYNCFWRSATVEDMARLAMAMVTALLIIVPAYLLKDAANTKLFLLPRSLPLIDGQLVFLTVGAVRFGARLAYQAGTQAARNDARRTLVVGAGIVGQTIVKNLRTDPQLNMRPIAFLDDDADLRGLNVLNLPVLGGHGVLPEAVADHGIEQVVIAIPHAAGKLVREIVQLCEQANVPAKIVPSMSAILDGSLKISSLRSVEIEDLLRREPIETDIAAVRSLLQGRRVLVTGGGGSIGAELCRQVLQCEPAALAILGHGENSVFEIHGELLRLQQKGSMDSSNGTSPAASTVLRPIIADIRFPKRIRRVMNRFQPHVIFHAAAHKHVPLMEMNPTEAITNNVLGTKNLLDAALAAGVEHFVMISTDKAVNPTSVMGASKRAAELLVQQAARQSGSSYVAVRFGNVLGSRGSVVPIFRRQIAEGGPVTVSHPEMRRYFMTIPEAVQLVLQASVLGRGGEVFMLDMGEPVKIVDLARDLIELSGLEVGRDIDIAFSGIRPGEKLFEELLITGEIYQATCHDKIRIARDAGGSTPLDLESALAAMKQAVDDDDAAAVAWCLQELVPEYRPGESGQAALPALTAAEAEELPSLMPFAVTTRSQDRMQAEASVRLPEA